MLQVSLARLNQGHRTIAYAAQEPALPDRFRGLPVIDASRCPESCLACADACPTSAITCDGKDVRLDLGRCLFCTDCTEACPEGAIRYTQEYRLATRTRADLVLHGEELRRATGPVSANMRSALLDTYAAVPAPKLVIAVGACAISGGPYIDNPEVHNGCESLLPVDLYVPGCPPHPITILDGLLRLLGRLPAKQAT